MNQLNDKSMCIMCGKGLTSEDGYDLMVCHHVSYFPEIISFVHYLCHRKIHDTMKWEDKQGTMMITNDFIEGKMKTHILIDYKEGDSRKFYDNKRAISKPSSLETCTPTQRGRGISDI